MADVGWIGLPMQWQIFTTAGHTQPCRGTIIFQAFIYTYISLCIYKTKSCSICFKLPKPDVHILCVALHHFWQQKHQQRNYGYKTISWRHSNSLSIISNQNHKFVNSFRYEKKRRTKDIEPVTLPRATNRERESERARRRNKRSFEEFIHFGFG